MAMMHGPSPRWPGRPTDPGPRSRTRTPHSSPFRPRATHTRDLRPGWHLRPPDRLGARPVGPTTDRDLGVPFELLGAGAGGPILVVEDDDFGREALSQILEAGGYAVVRAANGEQALRQLRAAPWPRLIVLDLVMPQVNGFQLCARLQRDPVLA